MLHACAERFDMTENLENFLVFRVNDKGSVHPKTKNFSRFSVTSNLAVHAWSIKYR